jgi:hypothetical protein
MWIVDNVATQRSALHAVVLTGRFALYYAGAGMAGKVIVQ